MATTPFSQSFSAESYFATQPPPSTLSHDIAGVRDFVQRQILVGKRVVLVTVSKHLPNLCDQSKEPFSHQERWNNRAIGAQRVSTLHMTM